MYLLLPKIYMHFESIVSKDLERQARGKTTFGSQSPEGRKTKMCRQGQERRRSTEHISYDSAKLLSYTAPAKCEPMYKNERVFINFCCAGRVNKTETLTNSRSNNDDYSRNQISDSA